MMRPACFRCTWPHPKASPVIPDDGAPFTQAFLRRGRTALEDQRSSIVERIRQRVRSEHAVGTVASTEASGGNEQRSGKRSEKENPQGVPDVKT